ncbi:MAG: hypothetical protein JRJ85_20700, partial [Deltaproteobacteria bacterium]|nr:hypothetical protein [Deltaproteobacteria bacterium]
MTKVVEGDIEYVALNPEGSMPEIDLMPLTPRTPNLNNKVIYLINSWRVDSELAGVLDKTNSFLAGRFPGSTIVPKHKPSPFMSDDPDLWEEMIEKADAFIYGASQSCATTVWSLTWAAGLEKRGLPGVVVMFETFADAARKTCLRLGMPVRWVSCPYPPEPMTEM